MGFSVTSSYLYTYFDHIHPIILSHPLPSHPSFSQLEPFTLMFVSFFPYFVNISLEGIYTLESLNLTFLGSEIVNDPSLWCFCFPSILREAQTQFVIRRKLLFWKQNQTQSTPGLIFLVTAGEDSSFLEMRFPEHGARRILLMALSFPGHSGYSGRLCGLLCFVWTYWFGFCFLFCFYRFLILSYHRSLKRSPI